MLPSTFQSFNPFRNDSMTNESGYTGEQQDLPGYWTEVHKIFTRCTGVIGAVNARILMLRYSKIRCGTPAQRMKVESLKFIFLPRKLIATPHRKTNIRFIIPTHRSNNSENLVRCLAGYADFRHIFDTGTQMSNDIFGLRSYWAKINQSFKHAARS